MPCVLYFNELSSPPANVTSDELHAWSDSTLSLIAGLRQVGVHKSEFTLAFPSGQWHAIYANRPFSSWLKERIKQDQYRWLLSKMRFGNQRADLLHQVYFNGQPTAGLTCARIADSWAFSFPLTGSPWLSPTVVVTEYRQEGENITDSNCEIAHIANLQHALHWRQCLIDWRKTVAENNLIGIVSEHHIEMYPIDHGYPHVHLVAPQLSKTIAKFRIDKFERMEGIPKWDAEMKIWIELNQDELLRSWKRCQCGGHPYKIV
jgi:hypothetical protein